MKLKKILCGMLAATLVAGALEGSIIVNAAEEVVEYEFDASTGTITKYLGDSNVVQIPNSIDGVSVKVIGEDAFASNENITIVNIPEGVESIETEAFLNCPNLEMVEIPDSVTELGRLSFFMCENLEDVSLGEGIVSLEENVFYGCSSLENIDLPDALKEIDSYAFMGCTALEEVVIPEEVTNVSDGAFQNCISLKEITIRSNVKEIGEDVFEGTKDLKILCEEGSVAESYAQSNGIANEVVKIEDVTLTPTQAPTQAPTNTPETKPTKEPTKAPEQQSVYNVTYVLKGGKFTKTAVKEYDGTVTIRLAQPVRKGYTFDGWYTESSYSNKVTAIKKGSTGDKKFYAKWTKVKKPSRPSVASVKNNGKKKMTVKLKKKVSGAAGYEMLYATNVRMTKNIKTVRFTGTSKTVKNLKKGKTYYVKVRAYKIDSTGNRVYGSYTILPKKVTITK